MNGADQAASEACFVRFVADGVRYVAPLDDVQHAQATLPENMPIVRLDAHRGMCEATENTLCYLVLGRQEAPLALAVEEVCDVVTITSALLRPLPERAVSSGNAYVAQVVCQGDGLFDYVLDMDRLRSQLGGEAL